jgi:hypothetical protein
MTTIQPPANPPSPTQPDPYANKAISAALATIGGVVTQFLATGGHLSLGQEGTTAIVGAVATVLVFVVSNWKRSGL